MINLRSVLVGLNRDSSFFEREASTSHYSPEVRARANSLQQFAESLVATLVLEKELGGKLDVQWYATRLERIQKEREHWDDWMISVETAILAAHEENMLERVEPESPRVAQPINVRRSFDYRTFKPKLGSIPKDPVDAARFKELQKLKSRL